MFNKDFYPTPRHVIDMMGIDCQGKTILEPSAGKGDIVDYLKEHGAKKVLVCEINPDLAEIVKNKGWFLDYDFLALKPEDISHIDMIVMNPPFSEGVKHILHAWKIAPGGCEIITLMNESIYNDDYFKNKREIKTIIQDYGNTTDLGSCFDNAERKTNVEVTLIKLYKPTEDSKEFEGFFLDEDPIEAQGEGIMKFDAIRDVVQRYVGAVKCFDEHKIVADKMSSLTSPFKVGTFEFSIGYEKTALTKEDFKKELQRKAWQYLFDKMNLNKYVTSGVMRDINKFVEDQTKIPFTMKNIYKMFEIIVGTREETFNRSLVEAVDSFTRHTHENRYGVEGWKTNEGHLLNHKFIINYAAEYCKYDKKVSLRYGSNMDKLEDIHKVLCSLTGKSYESLITINTFRNEHRSIETNEWHEWSFFDIKVFKKGTMHLKFRDIKVWEILNRKYGAIKGQVLPEKFKI